MKENKLIAEFMGIESDNAKMRGELYECPVTAEYVSHLEYKTSWDWLMPVIQECYILNDEYGFDAFDDFCDLDIRVSHSLVVDFINEYNKNK